MVTERDRMMIAAFGVAPATFAIVFPALFFLPSAIAGVVGGNPRLLAQVGWIVFGLAGTAGLWWIATSQQPFSGSRKRFLIGMLLCGMAAVGMGLPATLDLDGGELILGIVLAGPLAVGILALALVGGGRMSAIGLILVTLMSVVSMYGT